MSRRGLALAAAAAAALLVALLVSRLALRGPDGGDGLKPDRLTSRIGAELLREGASSAIVLIQDGSRRRASAVAAPQATAPHADDLFRVGSVTKTFTAVLVLQLAQEGKLGLDDTLAQLLPGTVEGGERITVRQLLRHQSGLASYTDYADFLEQAESSPRMRPLDVLRFAARQPRLFDPGDGWAYANTNYVALGLIVERVSGNSYAHELRRRILEPLRLERTRLPGEAVPAGLRDSGTNPRVPWAAGALVSDAGDVARFYSALLAGRLLSKASLEEMERTIDVTDHIGRSARDGLGIFSSPQPCGTAWWHTGGILDYSTLALASADGRRSAVVLVRGSLAPPGGDVWPQLLCGRLD